ncbi:myb-related transcription factor, partner of profilin-like [Ambystoma mexicanum]|uniref:myb-related transcription factor, partner of profilin-like n=1 Tax=Ambystoma mexicanum TaxID=8296 RepID=UPI0037E8DA71
MPKAVKEGASRQRKERFSEGELTILADSLAENAEVVFANDLKRAAQLKTKEIWELVAQKVSAVGNTPCTVKGVRKCWDDLRLRVRHILSANRSQGLANGGGSSSLIKLSHWEETCASTIGIELIEGVGEMEHGATSSTDGGSDPDSEAWDSTVQATTLRKKSRGREEGNRPSTSKGPCKAQLPQKAKAPQDAKSLGRLSATATAAVPTTAASIAQEPVADGALSAVNSSVREAAATSLPLWGGGSHSTPDDEVQSQGQVCVPVENVSSDLHGTSSPPSSPQITSISTTNDSTQEQSGGEPGRWSPTEDPERWSPTEDPLDL